MATPRDENIYGAKLAEQAERYSEMVDFMKKKFLGIRNPYP